MGNLFILRSLGWTETEGEQYGTVLAKWRRKAAAALRQAAPRVYAHGALTQALELIRGQQVKGELPPKVRQPFFQDLLEQELCVCGRHLQEGSEFRAHVVERMNAVTTSDEEVQTWIDGRYKLERIIEEMPDLVGRQRELGRQIRQLEEQIRKGERQLKEIAEKYGDVKEVELLDEQRHEYERALIESNQKIGRGQVEIERLEKEVAALKTQLERALKADKRRQDLLAKVKLSKKAYNVLREIRQELVSEVREQIERKTQAYFLNLIWKKETYQRIQINKKYQVSVMNVRGMSSLGTLSAGEQQVLALSFMAALGTVSGFNAPVVIDTPIGRISGEPRNNIAESLPNYLSDAQLILLMTDTEYTTEVAARLKPRIGKQYRLTFIESEAQTKVVTVDRE
jgi:DNA sulfur modification protein DndD